MRINQLGLVAAGKRNIRSGSEYERYFDRSEHTGKEVQLKASGDTFDTIVLMKDMVQKNKHQAAKIAQVLKAGTRHETCKNIWNFVYNHFQYKLDSAAAEQLRTPLRSWVDRREGIDCDCMSILISSILANLKIPHALRKTKYSGKDYFQHIYVVVPFQGNTIGSDYIIMDAVVDRFNYEVPFSEKHDLMMPIHQLSGLGGIALGCPQPEPKVSFQGLSGILAQANPHQGCFCHEFNGLGAVPGVQYTPELVEAEFLLRMKEHLQNTLTELKRNPETVKVVGKNPVTFRNQLELIINVWDDDELRDQLLDQLEAQENQEGQMNGFASLNGFFSRIKKGVKKVSTAVRGTAKKVTKAVKKTAVKVAKTTVKATKAVKKGAVNASKWTAKTTVKAGQGIKKGVVNASKWTAKTSKKGAKVVAKAAVSTAKAVVKYNPLSLAIRNGLLLALKINLFKMSERLGYALWTEGEARMKGLNIDQWKKVKATYDKALKVHLKLQGDKASFDKNLKAGWDHGTKKRGLLRGLGEVATATAGTAAASGVIATIVAWLSKIDFGALFQKLSKKPKYTQDDNSGMNSGAKASSQLPSEVVQEMNSGGYTAIIPGANGQGASVATPYSGGPAPLPIDMEPITAGMNPVVMLIGASVLGGAIYMMNKK
jgi:hypothetical protein